MAVSRATGGERDVKRRDTHRPLRIDNTARDSVPEPDTAVPGV